MVIRLDEGTCTLDATSFDEVETRDPRIEHKQALVPNCTAIVNRFVDSFRAGGGAEENQDFFDATSWSAEFVDERGHHYAEIRRPIEDRRRQRGIATACQILMDAAKGGAKPAASPPG